MSARPPRLPPLNALRAFEAAARLQSFARAADELNVTPGAISQQIKLLEDTVGQPLFVRQGRGLGLTPVAKAALPRFTQAFVLLTEGASSLRRVVKRRKLTVSVAPSFAAKWLVPRIDEFQQAHPDVDIWISADMALARFDEDPPDFAIRYGGGEYPGLESERLLTETVLPVCAPQLLEGEAPLAKPADLERFALLHERSPEADPSCPDWASWLAARGLGHIDASKGPRFNQANLVIEAAAAGRGVALAKRTLAQTDLASGRLVAPFADGSAPLHFAYWIVRSPNQPLDDVGEDFLAWLRRQARDHDLTLGQL